MEGDGRIPRPQSCEHLMPRPVRSLIERWRHLPGHQWFTTGIVSVPSRHASRSSFQCTPRRPQTASRPCLPSGSANVDMRCGLDKPISSSMTQDSRSRLDPSSRPTGSMPISSRICRRSPVMWSAVRFACPSASGVIAPRGTPPRCESGASDYARGTQGPPATKAPILQSSQTGGFHRRAKQ